MYGENVAKMQRGTVDRISELPEFILHNILSILDTKEAGRVSVLSKRWFAAWSSIPVLDFQPRYFKKFGGTYDDDTVERFVGFIDKTLERYNTRKFRITKMYLMLLEVDEKIEPLVDKWIMIAVQNQIERLEFRIMFQCKYRLPEILFCAKSLKYLDCLGVVLPTYEIMELVSLEYLIFVLETIDEGMLQRIISCCPLVELDIRYAEYCLENISIPWVKKTIGGVESRGTGTMQPNLQEYPLQKFVCSCLTEELLWPWNMNVVALKNLRKLEFEDVAITDDTLSELSYGLVALESLVIYQCSMLKCINISSNSLKQLRIAYNPGLEKARIDAPKLLEFFCTCEVNTSLSLIRAVDHCNAQFYLYLDSVAIDWLAELKKFLLDTNFFKSLKIKFSTCRDLEMVEDQLRNANAGTGTGVPYKLRELKLRETSILTPTKSSLVAFLDGLFWCCHPDVLSMTTNLQDAAAKLILSILQEKAKCWKDPLKSIEVESIAYPRLLSPYPKLEIRLGLSW